MTVTPLAMEAPQQQRPLKMYFIPYLAAGHLHPLSEIATLFSSRGHHVTIITTPSNAQTLLNSLPPSAAALLHFHIVEFPSQQAGLPNGVENFTSVSDLENSAKLYRATLLLREPITRFMEQDPPDCVVADFMVSWVDDVATNKLRIPWLSFNGFSLVTVCAKESLRRHPFPESQHSGPFVVPPDNFPHQITIRATPPKGYTSFINRALENELKSYGLVVNSFAELDGEEYARYYREKIGHRAWHVGPTSLVMRKTARNDEEMSKWLDSKAEDSVLYICFGSLCHFPDKQLYEIACALEASGWNFVWVVPEKKGKEEESEEEKQKWLPKGFEESIGPAGSDKGVIVRGWPPQVMILNHPAVGAFLTHCGWNSTVEAVSSGVPLITWPVHSEQFYNEKLVSEVNGIGVEIGADEWRVVGFGERERLVGRDSIESAVMRLMTDGCDDAVQIRRRARQFAARAREAVQEGGSSYNNLTTLIDELKCLRDSKSLD